MANASHSSQSFSSRWAEAAVPQNFGALPPEHADWEGARVAVLPVPYDLTTSYGAGARHGPAAIIAASQQLELYDEELDAEPYEVGVTTLPPLESVAAGPEAMSALIQATAGDVLDAGKFPIWLGGDHSITHGVVRALAERHGRFSLLQIDAHADLRAAYQGTPWSHACVARRALEAGASVAQIGIRSLSAEEAAFLKTGPAVTTVTARELARDPRAFGRALDALFDPVYVTLDVDAFDPSVVPGTGTPEPGGLDWYAVLSILEAAFERRAVVGADVVELAPAAGLNGPAFMVAKLVYKMIGYWQRAQRGS